MSKEDPPNPFEEIQKQLNELFKNPNIKLRAVPLPHGGGADEDEPGPGGDDAEEAADGKDDALEKVRNFNMKPREIRDYLDRFVIRQDEAKKVLSVAICDHYNHVRQSLSEPEQMMAREYSKQNILLLGPTGVGKTYLMRNIARLVGVPFVKADATKFSETGYVGGDVDDLVRDLVKAADGNVELAEYGIIFVDEIDKIAAEPGMTGRDVSGRGVQINLLKLMEETEVNLFSPTDMMSQMQAVMDMQRGVKQKRRSINTRNILFIVSGAFDKLAQAIKKRVSTSEMGFGAAARATEEEDDSVYLRQAETRDFLNYGFEPEFIGRVPVRVSCESLSAEDLARILTTSEGSVLNQYRDDFRGYGIDFKITPEAIAAISGAASRERTGARGLMTVLERVFRDFKFELPSTAIREFEVTSETIESPRQCLVELKEQNAHLQQEVFREDVNRFAAEFQRRHGFRLEFNKLAEDALINEAVEKDRTLQSLCEEKFSDFQHGLKIIERNTGQTVFRIGKLAVENPDRELSKWVVRSIESLKKGKDS